MITELDEPEITIRKIVMKNTYKAVFCDSTEINKTSVFTVFTAKDISCIVTDDITDSGVI